MCDESCLELCKDTITHTRGANCLKMIGIKPITYKNSFPTSKRALRSKSQVNYVEYIVVTRYIENPGM